MEKKKQFAIIDDLWGYIDDAHTVIDTWMGEYKEESPKWKRLYKTKELIGDVLCDLEHLSYAIDHDKV